MSCGVSHTSLSRILFVSNQQRCPLLPSCGTWRRVVSCVGSIVPEQRALPIICRWRQDVHLNRWYHRHSFDDLTFRTSRLQLFIRPTLWWRFECSNSTCAAYLGMCMHAAELGTCHVGTIDCCAVLALCSVGCCCCLHCNDAPNLALLSRTKRAYKETCLF
jgi:hypothetical protein